MLVQQIVLNRWCYQPCWVSPGRSQAGPFRRRSRLISAFAAALTPCALFAIRLGLSVEAVRSEARGIPRVDGHQARDHATGRVRPVSCLRASIRSHHCRRGLCRRADCGDSVHPSGSTRWRRICHRHSLDHDAAVGPHAAGLALRPSGLSAQIQRAASERLLLTTSRFRR